MKVLTLERIVLGVLIVVTGAGWTGRVAAQAPQSPDVLSALLTEVRGLRAAMEQMASATPRVQLFASRLQIQETRIANMTRRLQDIRDSMASAQQGMASAQAQEQQFETHLAELRMLGTPESREEVKQMELMLGEFKRNAIAMQKTQERLTAEEAQLSADLITEQGRWSEISARLDELDRALSRR
jgi:hypothetical protein